MNQPVELRHRPSRGWWPLRDITSLVWLLAAVVVVVGHRHIPDAEWLVVHLVLLGAITHAILVWSLYFAEALLKVPTKWADRRHQNVRLVTLLVGSAAVVTGVPTGWWPLTVAGASLVGFAVGWHGLTIAQMLRKALPGRFRVTIRYYLAAALSLLTGATLGAILARVPDDPWHGRLLLAHAGANVLGWVGFSVLGTLVTFWPTMLRTRIDERADRLARQALPVLGVGVLVLIIGSLVGQRFVALAGLGVYLLGVIWWGRALLVPLRAKPPREFAAASVGVAMCWAVGGLIWLGVLVASASEWTAVTAGFGRVALTLAIGFGAQLLMGALSYLIPVVQGGGPAAARAGNAVLNRHGAARLVIFNAALLIVLAPTPAWITTTMGALAAGMVLWFGVLLVGSIRSQRAAVANPEAAQPPSPGNKPTPSPAPSIWTAGQLVAALAALSVAVVAGVAIDPAAAGFQPNPGTSTAGSAVTPTGQIVRVTVHAADMRFTPASVTVQRGDQLVIDLVNDDPTTAHDLAIGGKSTPRLLPGQQAELDLGVVGSSTQGWCTIPGHRQAGMVFDVLVAGSTASPSPSDEPTSASAPPNSDAPLATHIDPVLAPLTEERVHRLTFEVTEEPLEVAPGSWQQRWTYNGGSVGPTLHGRIGDTFEVTLVNNGTMGHSIDFHAGELAPDEPMRTIAPGESLVYTFTANRAGVWMYHCSTAPMSAHIAAGMHGAVAIEPNDLPAVDRSYVVVQSEVYLSTPATSASEASEVDADQVGTKAPDYVVFNGIANQYQQFPFTARVGERVRFWVLDAGPNLPMSFHIVGGQFDTAYAEGAYLLRRGEDAFGNTGGGAQALGLQVAQGGFVELVFPEAGHYPVVTHFMSDAERGAKGVVDVQP